MSQLRSAEFEPVIAGFHPDPTICRVGNDYYLANSSFEYFPAAPIFHSVDLVNWSQIGNILDRESQFNAALASDSSGIYGSTLRHHNEAFWFITTNVAEFARGQLLVSASNPAGPWSEPIYIPWATGIDPDICWDDQGDCYLTWNALSFDGPQGGIRQSKIDITDGSQIGQDYQVWQGSGLDCAEGPHLYKIGNWWYLLLAEGGTERGHCVTVARAKAPYGPFESCPENPIFSSRSTIHPVQNVGHADLVEKPDGTWAAVYLGVRPHGSTPGFHVLGRETFLSGLDWHNEWPVFVPGKFAVPENDRGFVESFQSPLSDFRWIRPGSKPLNYVRVTDRFWCAESAVLGDAVLELRIDSRHWFAIKREGNAVTALAQVGDVTSTVGSVSIDDESVTLRIVAVPALTKPVPLGHAGPDDIVLSALVNGVEHQLGRLDGRYLSTEVAGGFTGRVVGYGSLHEQSRITEFRYTPSV